MAQINPSSLRDWNNGDTIDEAAYEQERQILYTAINDNYARLIKQYFVKNADGSTKTTQALDTAINYINFKDSSTIQITLDNATSTLTFALASGAVSASGTSTTPITGVTGSNVQAMLSSLQSNIVATILGQIPDGTITTAKLADGAVTNAKLEATVQTTLFNASVASEVYAYKNIGGAL